MIFSIIAALFVKIVHYDVLHVQYICLFDAQFLNLPHDRIMFLMARHAIFLYVPDEYFVLSELLFLS